MRGHYLLFAALLVAGCATQRRAAVMTAPPREEEPLVHAAKPTRTVETRYEIRAYRDARDPSVRHEPHAVYRSTRVPARVETLETAPRTEFAPVSFAPLPDSVELGAELATQRQITGELRAIQSSIASVEQRAEAQYSSLVNQTAETIKLRRQLEDERARVQELEVRLRNDAVPLGAATAPTAAAKTADARW